MMKKIFSKTAFTLIELIISSVLIVVVMMGLFSVNSALNNNNQDYGQRYLVRSDTQTTLNHILNDASLAVGSGTTIGTPSEIDQGILIGAQMGAADNNSFCIHQQAPGDIWVCYWLDVTAGDPTYQQISYCNKTYALNDFAGFRGASGACLAGTTQFLGTANSITNPAPSFSTTAASQMVFSITIQNCLNNTAATCNGSGNGVSSDPANNPEVSITGSAYPIQEGQQQS